MVFIESSKNEVWTLPPDIRDLIPSDHICYLVEAFVDMMDFSEFEIRCEGPGHPSYHPCILCKILIHWSSVKELPQSYELVFHLYIQSIIQPIEL